MGQSNNKSGCLTWIIIILVLGWIGNKLDGCGGPSEVYLIPDETYHSVHYNSAYFVTSSSGNMITFYQTHAFRLPVTYRVHNGGLYADWSDGTGYSHLVGSIRQKKNGTVILSSSNPNVHSLIGGKWRP